MRFMHTAITAKPHPSRSRRHPGRSARPGLVRSVPQALAALVMKALGGGSH